MGQDRCHSLGGDRDVRDGCRRAGTEVGGDELMPDCITHSFMADGKQPCQEVVQGDAKIMGGQGVDPLRVIYSINNPTHAIDG